MLVKGFEIENVELDFFKVNPHLQLPFKELITKWDNPEPEVNPEIPVKKSKKQSSTTPSESKPTLSQVMWAIALYADYDSPYFNFPDQDRREMSVEQSGCPKGYKLVDSQISIYDKLQEDSEKRYFRTWCDKVDEANNLLKDTKMTLDNMEDLMKAMEKLDKLLVQKDKIIDRINKKKKDNVRGDKELSGLESGLFD